MAEQIQLDGDVTPHVEKVSNIQRTAREALEAAGWTLADGADGTFTHPAMGSVRITGPKLHSFLCCVTPPRSTRTVCCEAKDVARVADILARSELAMQALIRRREHALTELGYPHSKRATPHV